MFWLLSDGCVVVFRWLCCCCQTAGFFCQTSVLLSDGCVVVVRRLCCCCQTSVLLSDGCVVVARRLCCCCQMAVLLLLDGCAVVMTAQVFKWQCGPAAERIDLMSYLCCCCQTSVLLLSDGCVVVARRLCCGDDGSGVQVAVRPSGRAY